MTPRLLLAAISLSTVFGGVLLGIAAPATADDTLCVGGESQRKPGQYQGVCIGDLIPPSNGDINKLTKDVISIGH